MFARPRSFRHLFTFASLSILMCSSACALQEGDAGAEPLKRADRPTNRLAKESSPYLIAHAHNPVDWYPWGPEALERAKKEGKLIFLSVGYSSCHWCHVMEQKVFSDPEIARYMNDNFVNIKVDREERPDLDDIYMTALTLYFRAIGSNQGGGWPLSMFLTPDAKPLGGGTYFPPADSEDLLGFPTLMKRVIEAWSEKHDEMAQNADVLSKAVQSASRPRLSLETVKLDRALVTAIAENLASSYDPEYGGFGFDPDQPQRPKFPVPTKLALLQYEARRSGDEKVSRMLYDTLDRMAAGGIHDQLGGGFHRYSTDRFWRVPHFEKMLYDNAQLADLYIEAFRQTNHLRYQEVAEGILAFVARELTDTRGGFYSALDADSDGVEGKYYVWPREELTSLLNADQMKLIEVAYGVGPEPEFEEGYVLWLAKPISEAARELKMPPMQLGQQLGEIKHKLLAARNKRRPPLRDDKILTSWNGLMIRALAHAGAVFKKQEYIDAATKAANFVLTEMRDADGRLQRSHRTRQAKLPAYLDDYAFLVEGLLALNQATRDDKWLNAARRLTDQQLELFWDDRLNGCYFTATDHEPLLVRVKAAYDSVLPSGNSVTVRNLLRLASLSKQETYRGKAEETLTVFVPMFKDSPSGLTNMALALGEFIDAPDFSLGRVMPAKNLAEEDAKNAIVLVGDEVPAKKNKEFVTGNTYLSVDRLPAGATCKALVRLEIVDGWHINANPAQPDYMVPTQVKLKSKLGTKLAQVRYPKGQKIEVAAAEEPMLVYSGKADLLAALEIPAEAAGQREELTFEIKFQACNDDQCLPPKTMTLKMQVDVAPRGQAVKEINGKLFAPPKK